MGDVGEFSRGREPRAAWAGPASFASGALGAEANAIRGIVLGCALSAVFWVGLGALVHAALR